MAKLDEDEAILYRLKLTNQAQTVIRALDGRKQDKRSPVFAKAVEWIQNWPVGLSEELRRKLLNAICWSFEVSEAEVLLRVSGEEPERYVVPVAKEDPEEALRRILPKGGWFEWYDQFTRNTESPLSYHIFASLVVLGSALGRRVWMDMGFFKVWPNYAAIIIGPTGKVRKTSAADISKDFIHKAVLCPIMADKITPESLASSLRESGHHFIYAPEFAVLFGKQRYNEGLTTLVIRLLDSPDEWKIKTQARGEEIVSNLALNILGCSTLSLLSTASAAEVTSSGFLNRFVLVVEEDTAREFETPLKGPAELEAKLFATLKWLKGVSGPMQVSVQAQAFRKEWYHKRWKMLRQIENETAAEVIQRGDMHMRRTAMLMHLAQCGDMCICESCMQASANLIAYVERRIPQMVSALKGGPNGEGTSDLEFLLNTLTKLGGAADHSTLLRRVSFRMSSGKMKSVINTLQESGRVVVGKQGSAQFYRLVKED